MLLLSPALIWHWLPGEGGPEAAAAARPRPPGIFERCSWVPAGWQTWQRWVGRTPKSTTRQGGGLAEGEREEEAGVSGHSAASRGGRREPGLARARPDASPPRGQAAQPGRHVGAAGRAGLLRSPGGRLLGHRGHIVPVLGPAEEQAVAGTLAVLPGGEAQSPTPRAPGLPREPVLTNAPRSSDHGSESSLVPE